MPAIYALSAFLMTLAGGAFAFRYRRYLLYIMAFSSGLVIGVAFLDLIPEVTSAAFHEGIPMRALMVTVVVGFVAIFLLEKLTIIHSEKQHDAPGHHHNVGLVGALGLSFHSFLDGLAIGVAFEAGPRTGVVVLLAVVAHDFADGLNTVTFMLATRNNAFRTGLLLLIDALAPVAGALVAGMLRLDPRIVAFQLSFFAGVLLYLGASDLLPQVHERPKGGLIVCTVLGLLTAGLIVYAIQSPA
ncbi:MAG TPA: ZIP family metal transporter [Thermoanaerobaculia bacterium]